VAVFLKHIDRLDQPLVEEPVAAGLETEPAFELFYLCHSQASFVRGAVNPRLQREKAQSEASEQVLRGGVKNPARASR
jgi:hypothetical protein